MTCMSITVEDFVADGATLDADGIVWEVKRLTGWWDSASVVATRFAAQPFGEIVTYVRENGRPLSLEMWARHPDPDTALGKLLCFTAMDSISVPFKCVYQEKVLEVIDPVLTLHASVKRVGPILSTILGSNVAVKFLVPLLAEDPFRYDALDQPYD